MAVIDYEQLTSTDGKRWAFFKTFSVPDIDNPGQLYLWRLRIIQTPWFGLYLHRIDSDDGDRPDHDHPWTFLAVTLIGGYVEKSNDIEYERRPWRPHWHLASYAHSIKRLLRTPTWTLVIVGSRVRDWGFLTSRGWEHWKPFLERQKLIRDALASHYFSTYCIFGTDTGDVLTHRRCRLWCKCHHKPCRCPCHTNGEGLAIPEGCCEQAFWCPSTKTIECGTHTRHDIDCNDPEHRWLHQLTVDQVREMQGVPT